MQHIYLASVLDVAEDFEEKLGELHEQRRTKVLRCKNMEDRKRSYLAGRLLAAAARAEGVAESGICLAPYDWETLDLKAQDKQAAGRLFGNISHAGNYVAVAISDAPVGVDIEQYGTRYGRRKEKNIDALAKKVLSEAEFKQYARIKEQDGQQAVKEFFLKLWTRKEACAKWIGTGIAADFSRIDALDESLFFTRKIAVGNDDFLWLSVYPAQEVKIIAKNPL